MTADELRQASGEMRRLAEAAAPSPWNSGLMGIWSESDAENGGRYIASSVHEHNPCKEAIIDASDRMHIAAWHPAVALAVADMLDESADAWEMSLAEDPGCADEFTEAYSCETALARSFLGTTP